MNNYFKTLNDISVLISKGEYNKIFAGYFKDQQYRNYFYYKIAKNCDVRALQALVDDGCLGSNMGILQAMVDNKYSPNDVRLQSNYLKQIADKVPEKVVPAFLSNDTYTKNVWATVDVIETLIKIPTTTSCVDELIQKVIDTKDSFLSGYSPVIQKQADLIKHLAENNKADFALTLAQNLFALVLKDKELAPKYDSYHYGEMFKKVAPVLTKAKSMDALTWICGLLKQAIEEDADKHEQPEDNLFIMRPNIESPKYRMEELADILIDVVIIAASKIIKDGFKLKTVCDQLEKYNWDTFTRIMLYLLMDSSDIDLIKEKLLNKKYFFKQGLYREYYRLLKKYYSKLDQGSKDQILGMIDDDEDLLALKERLNDKGRTMEDKRYNYLKRLNKYKNLSAIEKHLPRERTAEFEALKKEFSDKVEDVEYGTPQTKTWMGPTSDYSREELQKKTIDELIECLATYIPPSDFMAPSREGLGRVISDIIADEPSKYANDADKFLELDQPIYIRNIFWGFNQALRKQKVFDWERVIALLLQIVDKSDDPKHEPTEEHHDDNKANWRTTKSSLASLVYEGLNTQEASKIPIKYEGEIYSIIQELLKDGNPTAEDDKRYANDREYYNLAINSTRGKALECLIKYALWVREDIKRDKGENFVAENGFNASDRLKDVGKTFKSILENEKTLSVISVFGFHIPWLILLDKSWCKDNKKIIFPEDDDLREKRAVIWHTYIKYSQPYNIVFDIFRDEYQHWVDNWKILDDEKKNEIDDAFGLLQHAIQFYWRKKQDNKEEYWFDLQGKVGEFCFEYVFNKMPKPAIAKLFGFIGRMLISEKNEIPGTTKERLKALWDHRFKLTMKSPDEYRDELGEFVDWFVSGVFDDEWSFGIMKQIFVKIGYPKEDYHLFNYLQSRVNDHPDGVFDCIKEMIDNSDDEKLRNKLFLKKDVAKEILKQLYNNVGHSSDKKGIVENIINRIGSLGQEYYSFGEILGFDIE